MPPIKVLFVYHTANRGGVDEYLYTVLKHMHREKLACTVLLPQSNSEIEKRYTRMELPVINMGLGVSGYRVRDILKIYRIVKQYDMIYGNSFCKSTRTAGLAAKLARRPFIWHIYEVLNNSHASLARFLKLADRVAAISNACRDSLLPFANGDIPVIYNPFDTQLFQCSEERHTIMRLKLIEKYSLPQNALICLTIGRVSEEKGIYLLLQIAKRMSAEFPQAFFFVIGDWVSSQEEIQSRQHDLGLDGRMIFTGFQEDLLPYLHGSDLLLHPSRYESFGRVIAEGLACGIPAVAFDLGGIAEVYENDQSGFLISPFDVDRFAQQAGVLLRNENLRRMMGEKGRLDIKKRFSILESVSRVENMITKVYSSKNHGNSQV